MTKSAEKKRKYLASQGINGMQADALMHAKTFWESLTKLVSPTARETCSSRDAAEENVKPLWSDGGGVKSKKRSRGPSSERSAEQGDDEDAIHDDCGERRCCVCG